MQGLLIVRWTVPKPGHEVEAMKLADDADRHYSKLLDEGMIAGYEWVSNFTGSDGGMFIVRGDPATLSEIATSPEFGAIHLRGMLHLEHWHWDMCISGAKVDEAYPMWRELVGA